MGASSGLLARQDFYVSVGGDDAANGLAASAQGGDGPFETLYRARDAVRTVLETGTTEDIYVHIRGGRYYMDHPLVLGMQDGRNAPGQQIVYQAYEDETPVLTSAVAIEGWESVPVPPPGFPAEAAGHLFKADVSELATLRERNIESGLTPLPHWRFGIVYQGERRVPRASSERFDPKTNHSKLNALEGPAQNVMVYPAHVLSGPTDVEDAELCIIPRFDWTFNILPVESLDFENGICHTVIDGTYNLHQVWKWKLRPGAWFENVRCGLGPDSWYLDSSERTLYYRSADGRPPEGMMVSNGLMEYIRVEGDIRVEEPDDVPVSGFVFRGLTFTQGARDVWSKGHIPERWQHDWAGYDEASGLLRFRGASDCVVEDCAFTDSGANGIRLDLYCQNVQVRGNEFAHLGEAGVVISGYGPGTKNVSKNNVVHNNWFHHGGEIYGHAPAVLIAQSEANRVSNNLIHDYPYNGIVLTGPRFIRKGDSSLESSGLTRWQDMESDKEILFPATLPYLHARDNVVEENEIFRVMDGLGDGNAVYVSGAGAGNIIRKNYIHHMRGDAAAALRSDDLQWYVTYESNVIYKCTGLGILVKGPSDILNNYIIDQQEHFLWFPETISVSLRSGPAEGMVVQRNIYDEGTDRTPIFYWVDIIPKLPQSQIRDDEWEDTQVNDNLFWWKNDPQYVENLLKGFRAKYHFDLDSVVAQPLFVDKEHQDFRLREDSPARALGIESLDVSVWGLTGKMRGKQPLMRVELVEITPKTQIFKGPMSVEMSCENAEAIIHYTTDGTEPTQDSPRYEGPIPVSGPGVVRAFALLPDGQRSLDSRVIYYRPSAPIHDDFEKNRQGFSASATEFVDRGQYRGINLSATPGNSGRVLALGPLKKEGVLALYKVAKPLKDLKVSFEVKVPSGSSLDFSWLGDRLKQTGISFGGDGAITALGDRRALGSYVSGKWLSVSLDFNGGGSSPVLLTVNGETLDTSFIPQDGRDDGEVNQIRFDAASATGGFVYVDNITIE